MSIFQLTGVDKMPVKGGYLIAAGAGGILLWSGVKGQMWSQSLRSIISGQPMDKKPTLPITTSPAAWTSGDQQAAQSQFLPDLGKGGTVAKNKAIGMTLAAAYGWTGSEWTALDTLWTGESGWDNRAKNPSSGAYGIPQALPASKMGTLANPPLSSASAQIAWGLKYIKQVYGSPSNALAKWQSRSPHWY
jgi:hypothetical protein